METESTSIDSFDVYETAPLEQATGKILSSKWVHRLKETICKSRIVVRGFEQLWTEALLKPYTLTHNFTHSSHNIHFDWNAR
jgi:hypothetical protein